MAEKEEYEVVTDMLEKFDTVRKVLKHKKKIPSFKRPNTITDLFKNVKDEYVIQQQPGIYEIPLTNMDRQTKEVYVGATSRNLKDRLKEHEMDIMRGLQTTALARRAYKYDIKVEWGNAKLVRRVEDLKELSVAEGMKILKGSRGGEMINER